MRKRVDIIEHMFAIELDEELSESDRQVLPPGLEEMPMGPFLFAIIDSADRTRLDGHDLVRLMRARERMTAHLQAGALADIAEVSRSARGGPGSPVARVEEVWEFASMEIAAALHLTRRSADNRLDLALRLTERLPDVLEALARGDIDLPRARVIVEATDHLDNDTVRDVAARILPEAPDLTTGQLRARLQKLCIDADPARAKQRYQEAVDCRSVETTMNSSGTSNLLGYDLPTDRVAEAASLIHATALSLKRKGGTRTIDQLRADVFLDLLTGRGLPAIGGRGSADIRVELTTLAELDDRSGEIPGLGPVIADVARQVIDNGDREWRYTVTENGDIRHAGITRRRPDAGQRRRIEARSRVCVAPGCRMPAADCDIDHTVARSNGGPTTDCNLAPLCRYHHRAKHQAPWRLTRRPDGSYHWVSPMGHCYITNGQSP